MLISTGNLVALVVVVAINSTSHLISSFARVTGRGKRVHFTTFLEMEFCVL